MSIFERQPLQQGSRHWWRRLWFRWWPCAWFALQKVVLGPMLSYELFVILPHWLCKECDIHSQYFDRGRRMLFLTSFDSCVAVRLLHLLVVNAARRGTLSPSYTSSVPIRPLIVWCRGYLQRHWVAPSQRQELYKTSEYSRRQTLLMKVWSTSSQHPSMLRMVFISKVHPRTGHEGTVGK